MIDLTGAKVGDKFDGLVHYSGPLTVAAVASEEIALMFDDGSGFVLVGLDGTDDDGVKIITAKHDPRPWLKDLPDADLFSDDHWLAYNGELDSWFCFTGEPDTMHQSATGGKGLAVWHLKMLKDLPTITGWQWKDSKISIPELKAWQLANQ